ncbi:MULTISPECIES: HD-GYP domain-containing protein [Sutcliffiella]|uniref:HD-GYP domain-containing protein n=1 Tax=Sutcliffiella cohnii TaxID=33932 RepID=A0A223KWL3_9BACI|nr:MULTISPECIES: HD-GYP domain-containing protein [Sutcliffiella]AST93839.1 hypothetical protein BC6307_22460 [Sutcliffiella cohnii]MED4015829.1 HD-GYP domain-containing protein [Sutcliffiella cohnii]WBL15030.1 HD-GYP domain-containing protein [Sutcliffiella sp. NC1]
MKITNYYLGKVLNDDIYSITGSLLLKKGTKLTMRHIEKLNRHEYFFHPSLLVDSISKENNEHYIAVNSLYKSSVTSFRAVFQQLELKNPPPIEQMNEVITPLINRLIEEPLFVHYIKQVKSYDNYTFMHSMNVGIYASIIGKIQGLTKEEIKTLGNMGLYHDVGKLLIDKSILQKPGQLTEREWKEIQKHTLYGYELLKQIPKMDPIVLQGALLHHERLDGSGYPTKLRHEKIPYLVQILSVADVYDALSSNRSYREKQNVFRTAKILIQEANLNRLNPGIVKPFIQFLLSNHIRDEVLLNNGKHGEIIFIHHDEPHLPVIKVDDHFIDLRKESQLEILDFA